MKAVQSGDEEKEEEQKKEEKEGEEEWAEDEEDFWGTGMSTQPPSKDSWAAGDTKEAADFWGEPAQASSDCNEPVQTSSNRLEQSEEMKISAKDDKVSPKGGEYSGGDIQSQNLCDTDKSKKDDITVEKQSSSTSGKTDKLLLSDEYGTVGVNKELAVKSESGSGQCAEAPVESVDFPGKAEDDEGSKKRKRDDVEPLEEVDHRCKDDEVSTSCKLHTHNGNSDIRVMR